MGVVVVDGRIAPRPTDTKQWFTYAYFVCKCETQLVQTLPGAVVDDGTQRPHDVDTCKIPTHELVEAALDAAHILF